MIRNLAVVGTGLIGTSVALAARRQGLTVYLSDVDDSAVRTAALLGAGTPGRPAEPVELAVIAVPPSLVAPVLAEQQDQRLALSYTDVASVKADLEREVLRQAPDPSEYVGGHPLGGRERSGPLAARADLFRGRPWVLTPSSVTSEETFERAIALIGLCEAVPLVLPSPTHDEIVALTSHVPHLVATLMAARLNHSPATTSSLSGQGLRDVTRIAAGDSRLWGDIVRSNARAVAGALTELEKDLAALVGAVRDLATEDSRRQPQSMRTLLDLLDRGITGLDQIRPAPPGPTADVHLRIADQPGELGRLLSVLAEFGITPDDVVLGPIHDGRDDLLVRVTVAETAAEPLRSKLAGDGWDTGSRETVLF